ncbi:unnamed protein product [Hydatigera taeniaeformis]|uniref:SKA2 domain-containing protein n=1 Tax=Hydatigena taeniaeformis TaxID=6205 RepID=A0A0R3WSZ5_HYDTA|nr:unnamed protein product [Hydatigera taeniaeformis]
MALPSESMESREASFDEIENLRAEVKRLSDVVAEQSELITHIQGVLIAKLCFPFQKSSEDKPVDKLELLTEFNQHKIAMACLERDNVAMESMIKQLENNGSVRYYFIGIVGCHSCAENQGLPP